MNKRKLNKLVKSIKTMKLEGLEKLGRKTSLSDCDKEIKNKIYDAISERRSLLQDASVEYSSLDDFAMAV